MMDNRLVAIIGVAVSLVGIAFLVIGLVTLDASVEGAYFDRTAVAIRGKSWLIAGTVLVATGSGALGMAALRARPTS
jgi:hypothetical protein